MHIVCIALITIEIPNTVVVLFSNLLYMQDLAMRHDNMYMHRYTCTLYNVITLIIITVQYIVYIYYIYIILYAFPFAQYSCSLYYYIVNTHQKDSSFHFPPSSINVITQPVLLSNRLSLYSDPQSKLTARPLNI